MPPILRYRDRSRSTLAYLLVVAPQHRVGGFGDRDHRGMLQPSFHGNREVALADLHPAVPRPSHRTGASLPSRARSARRTGPRPPARTSSATRCRRARRQCADGWPADRNTDRACGAASCRRSAPGRARRRASAESPCAAAPPASRVPNTVTGVSPSGWLNALTLIAGEIGVSAITRSRRASPAPSAAAPAGRRGRRCGPAAAAASPARATDTR